MDTRISTSAPEGRTQSANNGKLLTILGSSARIEGKFQIAESIEVQCEITGEMTVGGTLVIGDRGHVAADVATVNAVIIGAYAGNLKASGSVEIASTGRVSGTIESHELVIAKGAVFTGSVTHVEQEQARQVKQPARVVETEKTSQTVELAKRGTPASAATDVETSIPVARLIELDADRGFDGDHGPSASDSIGGRSQPNRLS